MLENRKVVLITQARMGSTRLPGKVLKKLAGKEMLLFFIDRLLPSNILDKIVVATTINKEDDIIASLIENYNSKVLIFRGSVEDVLDRYYSSITTLFPDYSEEDIIVRVTSDCPLIDYNVVDYHINEFVKRDVDYLSSRIKRRTWPHGMDVEVFSFGALKKAYLNAKTPFEREHVTPYIYMTHPEEFKLYELLYDKDYSHIRITVDYPEDLHFISRVVELLTNDGSYFGVDEILNLLENRPELMDINKKRINNSI